MSTVYTLTLANPTYDQRSIVGIFEAQGLAEMAKKQAEAKMTDRDRDQGVYFSISPYELGKLYYGDET